MPNTFIKPTVIAATALGLLQRQIVLPGLVWLNGQGSFAGAAGDTVSIRVPGTLTARSRPLRGTGNDRTITLDTLAETKIDVTLAEAIYSAVPVTDEELTLDIVDFGVQVLSPQTRAVAEGLENGLAALMQGASYDSVVIVNPAATFGSVVDARKALNDANVPLANRALVVGSGIEAAILKDPQFVHVDQSGDDSALRDANIGRIAGFDVYVSNALDPDEGYAFHMTAFVMVTRAPSIPDGASFGDSQAYQGIAMRWLRDYDFANVQDRSLVDSYVGFQTVSDPVNGAPQFVRAVRLQLATSAITVTPTTKTLAPGATQALTVKDANAQKVPNAEVTFATSDPTKATVNTAGVISGVADGTATVTATYQGQTASCTVTVAG